MKIEIWKQRKAELGLSFQDLSDKTGISATTLKVIFTGKTSTPRQVTVQAIEKALGLSDQEPVNGMYEESVVWYEEVATVRAGYDGVITEEHTGRMIPIPSSMLKGHRKDDFMTMRVKGDSMYPLLLDGDNILCLKTDSVDSGDIAVMTYNGDEGTVKRVKYVQGEDWLELVPTNSAYPIKRVEGADLEQCRVIAKVVKLIRDL